MRRRATCDFGGNELRASPHRCTVIALPRLSPETRVQPLKHVADSPCYTTQGGWAEGGGVHPRGCHISQIVLLQ